MSVKLPPGMPPWPKVAADIRTIVDQRELPGSLAMSHLLDALAGAVQARDEQWAEHVAKLEAELGVHIHDVS